MSVQTDDPKELALIAVAKSLEVYKDNPQLAVELFKAVAADNTMSDAVVAKANRITAVKRTPLVLT